MKEKDTSPRSPRKSPFEHRPVAAPWQALVTAFTGVVLAFGLQPVAEALRGKLRTKWRGHTLDLARTIATMMEEEPALFTWMPFTAAQLRTRIEQVADLIAVQVRLEEFAATFTGALYEQRSGLFDWVTEALGGLGRLLDSPHLNAAQRQRLRDVSAPVRAIAEEFNAQVQAARADTMSKNDRLAASEEENERLHAALRTSTPAATLTAAPPPAAPRTGRRTRR